MKTAILFSGWPRFHAEFDDQLQNLHGSEIDWIVAIWKNYPADSDIKYNASLTPSWVDTVKTEDDARAWLKERMPSNHNLAHFSYVDWNDFPDYVVGDYPNRVSGTNPEALFRQYWMLKKVNESRKNLGPYDLVMRSRTDSNLSTALNLDQIHSDLVNDPRKLIIPSNGRQGLNWQDIFVIGMPETMDVYTSAVDYFNEVYFRYGVTMHPENIVSHTLQGLGLHWSDVGCEAHLRQKGKYLTPHFVEGMKYYEADFGRW
jgi:hypothetical protein